MKNKIFTTIREYATKVLKIFAYPFLAVIELLYSVTKSLFDKVKYYFAQKQSINSTSKKLIQETIRSVVKDEKNLLNSFSRIRMVKLFTALLQLISFITTFGGFVFLLGSLNVLAPFMLAIVVQGGCYYLMNYRSSLKHSGYHKKNVLLAILLIISIMTSYVGIFNTISSPLEYMENNYNLYQTVHNSMVEQVIKEKSVKDFTQDDIDNVFINFNSLIRKADSIIVQQESIAKSNEDFHSITSFNRSFTDPVTGNIINTTTTEDNINSSMAKDRANAIAISSALKEDKKTLKIFVEDNTPESIFEAYESLMSLSERLNKRPENYQQITADAKKAKNLYQSFTSTISTAKELINTIKLNKISINEYIWPEYDLEKVIKSKEAYTTLSSYKCKEPKELFNTEKENTEITERIKGILNRFNEIIVPTALQKAEDERNKINTEINGKYSLLYNSLRKEDQRELEKIRKSNLIKNIQYLPLYIPISNQAYLSDAIISFVLATFIDLVSLLFSLALLPKRRSSLYFDKVEKILKIKEEMLEDCLMYICLNNISKNKDSFKAKDLNSTADKISSIINNTMSGFMKKVKICYLPTALNAFGYIDEQTIEGFTEDERAIYVTLCNIAMIQAFHRDELIQIIEEDFDNSTDKQLVSANKKLVEKYKNQFSEDKVYYLVSRNLHVWFYDNFSELLECTDPAEK